MELAWLGLAAFVRGGGGEFLMTDVHGLLCLEIEGNCGGLSGIVAVHAPLCVGGDCLGFVCGGFVDFWFEWEGSFWSESWW